MKHLISLLLLISLATSIKAQKSPRDEYDTFAKFPDYSGDFHNYIADHVKKPETITADIKGQEVITVTIDSLGRAGIFKVSKSLGTEMDAQFAKAIAIAPKWKPAMYKGKPVNVYFTITYDVSLTKATGIMEVGGPGIVKETPDTKDKIYAAVQVQPSFPGGVKGYDDFFNKTMVYPKVARSNNVSGRVFLQFIVETDGSLSDVKVDRDPGSGLGDEALRVIKLSPKWKPGMQNGNPVRVMLTLPMNFNLAN